MRLIDANRLKQNVLDWEDCYNGFSDTYDKARIIDEIDAQPTIDAEPISHGKWIPYGDCGVTECSCCGWNIEECVGWNYCPNCGAKMDKEKL